MMIERECLCDPFQPHHFKTDRVGKAESMILKWTQPPIRRRGFQLASGGYDRV